MTKEDSETIRQLKVDIDTDTTDLEETIEQAERLRDVVEDCAVKMELLEEATQSISEMIKPIAELFETTTEEHT